jgi:hypothetical protein
MAETKLSDLNIQWHRKAVPNVDERRLAIAWMLGAKLRELGHATAAVRFVWAVDGHSLSVRLTEDSHAGYTRGLSGNLRFVLGGYGHKRQFPEPKGGFDIDKIAGLMSDMAKMKTADQAALSIETDKTERNHQALMQILENRNVHPSDHWRSLASLRCPAITAHGNNYDHGYPRVDQTLTVSAEGIHFGTGAYGETAVRKLIELLAKLPLTFTLTRGEVSTHGESHQYATLALVLSADRFATLLQQLLIADIIETFEVEKKEAANG